MLIVILLETPVYQLDLDPVRLSHAGVCASALREVGVVWVAARVSLQSPPMQRVAVCRDDLGVATHRSGWLLRVFAYPFHIRVYYSLD